ncbi:MAG: type III secretion system chaperone [Victivallales bacterium]|nr:type III secretion system chaperone [Victivallales bacterium]
MTVFESLIQEMARATGLPLRVTSEESCFLETADFPLLLQYRARQNDIVMLAILREPGITLSPQMMRKALELSFNGEKTGGSYLGISRDALVLSRSITPEHNKAEEFAGQLMSFAGKAQDILAEINAVETLQEEEDDEDDEDDDFPQKSPNSSLNIVFFPV